MLGASFWCDKGEVGVSKENSYSLASPLPSSLIISYQNGHFLLQSAVWYRDDWLLFYSWSYSLVFLPSWALILLVIPDSWT